MNGRRQCLQRLGTLPLWCSAPGLVLTPSIAAAHGRAGRLNPPVALGNWPLQDHLGHSQPLHRWLGGRVTAIQFMYTGCGALCPIQGAMFAELQARLGQRGLANKVQLISITIAPLSDTPQALAQWLAQHRAGVHWRALRPRPEDLDPLLLAFEGPPNPARSDADRHNTQVHVVDKAGRLQWQGLPLGAIDPVLEAVTGLL